MKKPIVQLFGIAFVVAILATGVFYGLFASRLGSASASSGESQVVVARRALDRGALLQAADVELRAAAGRTRGALTRAEQAIGLTVVEPIRSQQPILEWQVASQKGIPSGMRAISIHVSDSTGVVAMLQPGHRVDVQVIASSGGEMRASTILQNAEVLSVGLPDSNRPVVNLLATPYQADVLGLADSTARVRLTLRNAADSERAAHNVFSAGEFFKPAPNPER